MLLKGSTLARLDKIKQELKVYIIALYIDILTNISRSIKISQKKKIQEISFSLPSPQNIQGSCSSAPRSVLVDQAGFFFFSSYFSLFFLLSFSFSNFFFFFFSLGVVSALLVSFEKLKIFWEKKQRHQQGEE